MYLLTNYIAVNSSGRLCNCDLGFAWRIPPADFLLPHSRPGIILGASELRERILREHEKSASARMQWVLLQGSRPLHEISRAEPEPPPPTILHPDGRPLGRGRSRMRWPISFLVRLVPAGKW